MYIYIYICIQIHLYVHGRWEWWKWDILHLQLESNQPSCIMCQGANQFTTQTRWCHHPSHAYMSMRFFVWAVSAAYYPRPPGIVSLSILTIAYIQPVTSYLYIYRLGSTTTQCVIGGMQMRNIVPRVATEHKYLAFYTSVLTITLSRLPDVTIHAHLSVWFIVWTQFRLLYTYMHKYIYT